MKIAISLLGSAEVQVLKRYPLSKAVLCRRVRDLQLQVEPIE